MRIVENGSARATIMVGADATWLERHAAEELQCYLRSMTGVEIPLVDDCPDAGPVIAIGSPRSNDLVRACVEDRRTSLSEDYPGRDGFIVETVKCNGCTALVIGGSQDRGTLYGAVSYTHLRAHET